MASIASQKKRIHDILDSDSFEGIFERPIKDPQGRLYLTKAQVGKTAIIVVIEPHEERDV